MSDIEIEIQRTKPDYRVFTPRSLDGSTADTGNEHFLVFDGPNGDLMAVWTQSTWEGHNDQRILFSASTDEGATWADPRVLAGPPPGASGNMASWGFPLVSKSGRIYVIYNKHIGVDDIFTHVTGMMAGICSDDAGATWSPEQIIPMPRTRWDNPLPTMPANWVVWQKPERYSEGKYLVGITRWVSPRVRPPAPVDDWAAEASVVEFMRFENLDSNPAVGDMRISWFAQNDNALQLGYPGHPETSVLQEPSIVQLPDLRLFATMRSPRGNPYYSVSADGGQTWRDPEVLRRRDEGAEFLHPCSPCPIYPLSGEKFLFLFHNHDGHFESWGPLDALHHRRPIYGAVGEFRPAARQPVWFAEPRALMDNDGVAIGYGGGRCDLAMYASFTVREERRTLWYPDRKAFLLGKCIGDVWLDQPVPR